MRARLVREVDRLKRYMEADEVVPLGDGAGVAKSEVDEHYRILTEQEQGK